MFFTEKYSTIEYFLLLQVTSCYNVPHKERLSERYVAINTEYDKAMLNFHSRMNRQERLVGWYTTRYPFESTSMAENSKLIHDYYRGECVNASPIQLVFDSSLSGNLGIMAFISKTNANDQNGVKSSLQVKK